MKLLLLYLQYLHSTASQLVVVWTTAAAIGFLLIFNPQPRNSNAGEVLGVTNVNLSVTSGGISLDFPPNASMSDVTLGTHTQSTGNLGTLTVVDSRGTGSGWTLSVTASDFTCCSGSKTVSVTNFSINPGSVTTNFGASNVTSGTSHTFVSELDPTTIMTAGSNQGMGSYSVIPHLILQIPVGTSVGSYTATITTTIL